MRKLIKIYEKMPSDLAEQARMTDDELNLSRMVVDGKAWVKTQ